MFTGMHRCASRCFILDSYAHGTTAAQEEADQTMGNVLSM